MFGYGGVQERMFVEDVIVRDQYGRVFEQKIVVDDVYYGNGRVKETVVVEDIYRGNCYNNRWGEQVAVAQTAYVAEPVYGVNANTYMNNSGAGTGYYNNNTTLLLAEQNVLIRNRRRRNAISGISVAIIIVVLFCLIFFLV